MHFWATAASRDHAKGIGGLSLLNWSGNSQAGQSGCDNSLGEHVDEWCGSLTM